MRFLDESMEMGQRLAGAMLSRPINAVSIFRDVEGPRKHATPRLTFPIPWLNVVRWLLVVAALAGLPVLLHGCHGDEDHELFAPIVRLQR